MVDIRPFSLGNAFAQAEQVKGMRLRNAMSSEQLEETQRAKANRERMDQIRAQSENAGEMIKMLRQDGRYEEANALTGQQIQMRNSYIGMLEKHSSWVDGPARYEQLRSDLIREGAVQPEQMPVDFDDSFFKREARKERGKLSTFMRELGVNERGERVVQQVEQTAGGTIRRESDPFVPLDERKLREQKREARKASKAKRKPSGLSSGDSNTIRRAVVGAFDGLYNLNTGAFTGLKTEKDRQTVVRVAADAEARYVDGRAPTHGEAVRQALQNEGVPNLDIQGQGPGGGMVGPPAPGGPSAPGLDPSGFRQRMLQRRGSR